MKSIPEQEYSKEIVTRDLNYDNMPITRTLGVQWCIKTDLFSFSIQLKDRLPTRRGILSTVSSLYDPLGFVVPVILPAKKILPDLCKEKHFGWDDTVPDSLLTRWHHWLSSLPKLEQVKIDHCFKRANHKENSDLYLHVFSDASSSGYGSVAYICTIDSDGKPHVAFVAGKARLAPLKATSIPRLELTAAVTSVCLTSMLMRELDDVTDVVYYTDSTTVLHYIGNESHRFPVFIANRVQLIREFSQPAQWNYVQTTLNPADEASRGISVENFLTTAKWLKGPDFLYKDENTWPIKQLCVEEMDQESLSGEEHKQENVCITSTDDSESIVNKLLHYFSDWNKLKTAVAVYMKIKGILFDRVTTKKPTSKQTLTANDIEHAETAILQWLHRQHFYEEIQQLQSTSATEAQSQTTTVNKSSCLYKLDPVLRDGILRVGGRINRASLSDDTKHPIILPKRSHITTLIIRHEHVRLGHAGRNHVLSNLRTKYWIIGSNAAACKVITACVNCRKIRGPTQEQITADLPSCRLDDTSPPFSRTGVDYFSPFLIKERRKELKHYGVLFTCLARRAVHLEVATSLETDTLINVLRRVIARRGNTQELWSDNGTNFIEANNELKRAMQEMDQSSITSQLRKVGINWIFNPPTGSNMGGVWERLIRTVMKVLSGLQREHGPRLDSDSFHNLLCEVEAIINSRPITNISSDPQDLEPLTPNHILTLRSSVTVPPPGVFQKEDIYLKRRWSQVQAIANLFWSRWKKEYMLLLQNRQKWNKPCRNLQLGDIVLVKDDNTTRNNWQMGLVEDTEVDKKGYVRTVQLKTQNAHLRRPINKLVLLVTKDE